jgi:hypothetical protein
MANFYRISTKVGEDQAVNLDKVDYVSSYDNNGEVMYRLHIIKGEHEKIFEVKLTKELREKLGFIDLK